MEKNMIRLLKAEEIECRAATVNEKGAAVLGCKGGPEDTGRDLRPFRVEKKPPVHRRQPVLYRGSL